VHAPCPPGWKFSSSQTIEVAKKAVDSGMWVLYEIENGVKRITKKVTKRIPVRDYLMLQGRFKHLDDKQIATIQQNIDSKWENTTS